MIKMNKNPIKPTFLIIILTMFFVHLDAFSNENENGKTTIRKLPDEQILSLADEHPVRGLTWKDRGFASMYIPWKKTILNDWRLVAHRPQGEPVSATDKTKRAIFDELQKHLGKSIIEENIISFIETYTDLVPKELIEKFKRDKWYIERRIGIVYFVPLKKGPYNIQIVGELGSFISVFVKFPDDRPTLSDVCRELLPRIDLGQMKRNEDRFSKAVVDNYFETAGVHIKTGERNSPSGVFYGLRLDVETTEFITSVNFNRLIRDLMGEGIFIARVDNVVGEDISVARMSNYVVGEEISIAPQNNIRRGGPSGVVLKNSQAIGKVQIGVFSDQKRALEIFEEHLVYTSTGPGMDLSGELGNKAFGWSRDRILFTRDNAVVFVVLPKELCMSLSKAIDCALAEGAVGVERGAAIRMPRILKVEAPEKIFAGMEVDIKIHVAVPEDMNVDSEVGIVRALRCRMPQIKAESQTVDFEVCYATPGCVMASRKFTLDIVQKSKNK